MDNSIAVCVLGIVPATGVGALQEATITMDRSGPEGGEIQRIRR